MNPQEILEERRRVVEATWTMRLHGRVMRQEESIFAFFAAVNPVVEWVPPGRELPDIVDVQVQYVISLMRPEWLATANGVREAGEYHSMEGFIDCLLELEEPERAVERDMPSYASMEPSSPSSGGSVGADDETLGDSSVEEDPSEGSIEEDPSEDIED